MKYCDFVNIICDSHWNIVFIHGKNRILKHKSFLSNNTNKKFFYLLYRNDILRIINILENLKCDLKIIFIFKIRNNEKVYIKTYINKKYINNAIYHYLKIKPFLKDTRLKKYDNFINLLIKIIFISRLKFIIGSLIPFIFAIIWSFEYIDIYNYKIHIIIWSLFCSIWLHIAANTYNDYFDWISNTDQLNENYLFQISGGSRSIQTQILTPFQVLFLSNSLFVFSTIISSCILYFVGPMVLLGFFGFFGAFFYPAPPLKIAHRKGFGEFIHILYLRPLLTFGIIYIITTQISISDFLLGLPFGFIITACLCTNEYPDIRSDKISGKYNFITLYKEYLPIIILLLIIISYLTIFLGIVSNIIPIQTLHTIFIIPFIDNKIFFSQKNYVFMKKTCLNILKIYFLFFLSIISGTITSYIF